MELNNILNNIYGAKDETDLFDSVCALKYFIEKNGNQVFFEEKSSEQSDKFLRLKNSYTILHICKIFDNQNFIKSFLNILKYQRDYKELRSVPSAILRDGYFVNLSLNCCFYFVSCFSEHLTQVNIKYIGEYFWNEIKKIEKNYSYEFNKIDILNALESLTFDKEYFFKKVFSKKINGIDFYNNFKKSRLIIGNYLVDYSTPIILSNSFKKIISIKKRLGDGFSLKDAANRLREAIKKYHFLNNGFRFDGLDEKDFESLSSFKYYFEKRESKKVLMLVDLTIERLDDFSHDQIIKKIEESEKIIKVIREHFYKNYNYFPSYNGPKNETSQWGNKSFLNTIKFFTFLDVVKNSHNEQWKINIFLNYFNDWINDLHENINYFSELDDFDKIKNYLRSGESNSVEFKSTFGLPIQNYIGGKEEFCSIKKSIVEKIAYTILAMANSRGGNIFIGIVEKIDKVSDSIKPHIVKKEGICFLDIQFSLKKEKEDSDSKRLLVQQMLKNLTKERFDFLDSLFSFHFYKVYIDDIGKCIEILDIEVKKSEKPVFIKKDDIYITLPKRLSGRVELVNPESEFSKW